jgi:CBS domain-containing protein
MPKSIKVRDCMTRNPVSFRADTDFMRAIELLLEHRLSAAPVVDAHGLLIGLLSEGDCLRGMLSGSYYDAVGGTVAAYMATAVESVGPETDIIEVAGRFIEGGRHRLLVVENGHLLGLISRHDVLRAIKSFAQHDAR